MLVEKPAGVEHLHGQPGEADGHQAHHGALQHAKVFLNGWKTLVEGGKESRM
jgi:hypothetical protein